MAEKVFFMTFIRVATADVAEVVTVFVCAYVCVQCISFCISSHSLHWLVARALQYMSNTSIFGLSFFQRLLKWTNAKQQLMVRMNWYYWWHPCVILCTKLIFNFNLFCGLLTLVGISIVHLFRMNFVICIEMPLRCSTFVVVGIAWPALNIDIGALFSLFAW